MNPQIVEALRQNGFQTIDDVNAYAVQVEDYAQSLENDARQAFDYLIDPNRSDEERLEFVRELQRQALPADQIPAPQPMPQEEPYLRPAMAAPLPLPAHGYMQGESFANMMPQEILGIHSQIGAPDQMARFDEAVMNTPRAFWAQMAPYLIQGS